MVQGLVFTQAASHAAGGPTRIKDAKVALIQFQLSSPKSNIENTIVVDNYAMLDRLLRQERLYILNIIKTIKNTGCNVLLVQKSILRDAVSELALSYLAKEKIMVVKEIERDEVEFISKALGCIPIASIESFSADKLGRCELVEEISTSGGKIVKMTGTLIHSYISVSLSFLGIATASKFVTVFVRGTNALVVDEGTLLKWFPTSHF